MTIGEKIKDLRKQKKITQEQLAEYLSISSQAISKWETGLSSPDLEMLPRLAIFFNTTVDELLDFDHTKIAQEVDELISQSLPLRQTPEKAEAFYRQALEKYPNNEILLNCLLMVLPTEKADEKIHIAKQLLDCTSDDEIKYDVLRLLSQTYHALEQDAMAQYYLDQIPELYFLKTELTAALQTGQVQEKALRLTLQTCLNTSQAMLAIAARDKVMPEDVISHAKRQLVDLMKTLSISPEADDDLLTFYM